MTLIDSSILQIKIAQLYKTILTKQISKIKFCKANRKNQIQHYKCTLRSTSQNKRILHFKSSWLQNSTFSAIFDMVHCLISNLSMLHNQEFLLLLEKNQFLAAMSSSRSDVVTHFVSLSVTKAFFLNLKS